MTKAQLEEQNHVLKTNFDTIHQEVTVLKQRFTSQRADLDYVQKKSRHLEEDKALLGRLIIKVLDQQENLDTLRDNEPY